PQSSLVRRRPRWLSIFHSSRRRHTRSKRDWSSDVCSSDLTRWLRHGDHLFTRYAATPDDALASRTEWLGDCLVWTGIKNNHGYRSEERRVGKENRMGGRTCG